MTAPYNFDAAWQWLPYEPVTLYRLQLSGAFDSGTVVAHAVRQVLQKSTEPDLRLDARLSSKQIVWTMSQDEVGAPAPKADDMVTDGSEVNYRIDSVYVFPFGVAYQCQTTLELSPVLSSGGYFGFGYF